ncbi:MAG: PAS domain S-box protein, partial [Candidatus Competibacteraceae bacterium]
MSWGGTLRGFVGLDAVTAERTWLEEEIRLLRMVAEILAHTLQHIDSDRSLRDNAHFLENLDRISRILAQREQDADLLAELAAALLEIFQADRAFFLHPCDPDAAVVRIAMEATRPEYPGAFAIGEDIVADDVFRNILRQGLDHAGPVLTRFKGESAAESARRHGIQSQMTIGLHPRSDRPWLMGIHQCAYARQWTGLEQRLFQAIAERASDALSGHLLLRQLQESEERYRTVFENAHDAIIVHDFRGAIQAVNRTMLTLYGLEHEEALKATIADLSGPGNLSNPADDHWPRIARGEILHFEWNARKPKDGTCFPVEVILRAIRFGGENCILSNVRDIAERKRAEAALRSSEERFAKAFRSSPAAIVISTLDEGRFIDVNDRWLSMMGYTREEMIGRTSKEIGLWTDVEVRDQAMVEIRKTGAFRDIPARIRTKMGEEREQLWSAETITLDGQQVLLSHIYDITERKRAEEALQKNANEMQWLMKNMANAFVMWESVFDANGQFINFRFAYFNDAYEKVSGLKLEEVQGKTVLEVWPETEQSWFDVYGEVAITGNPKYFEMYHAPTRGLYACNAYRPWDTPDRICVVFEDVTERRRAEQELQRHREHLEELVAERTAELRQAMDQLVQSEKLAALGSLVAGVAHELNTPLGNARVIAGALGEHLRKFAAAVESGALRRPQVDVFLARGREAVDLLERNAARAADL